MNSTTKSYTQSRPRVAEGELHPSYGHAIAWQRRNDAIRRQLEAPEELREYIRERSLGSRARLDSHLHRFHFAELAQLHRFDGVRADIEPEHAGHERHVIAPFAS